MSEGSAKVEVDALKHFRRGVQLFCESVSAALGDGDSDLRRTQQWLEGDAAHYWQNETRKREKVVERCKEAVRMKSVFKDASGGKQSVVDEEKALKRAQQNLAVALTKSANVKKYLMQLQKEGLLYKGQVQRLATNVQNDLPTAAHKLAALIGMIEQYTAAAPVEAGSTAPGEATSAAMARPEISEPEFFNAEQTDLSAENENAVVIDTDASTAIEPSTGAPVEPEQLSAPEEPRHGNE